MMNSRFSRLLKNAHLRRYPHPFPCLARDRLIAAYFYVRLIPRDLSALAQTPHPLGGSPVSGALHLRVFEQPGREQMKQVGGAFS